MIYLFIHIHTAPHSRPRMAPRKRKPTHKAKEAAKKAPTKKRRTIGVGLGTGSQAPQGRGGRKSAITPVVTSDDEDDEDEEDEEDEGGSDEEESESGSGSESEEDDEEIGITAITTKKVRKAGAGPLGGSGAVAANAPRGLARAKLSVGAWLRARSPFPISNFPS